MSLQNLKIMKEASMFDQIIQNYLSEEETPDFPPLTQEQQEYLVNGLKKLGWKISK